MSRSPRRLRALLLNDTSWDDHHGCQLVVQQIYRLAAQAGIDIVWSSPVGHAWQADQKLLDCLGTIDLCLLNGEGTMHDDAPAALRLLAAVQHLASQATPCFLINSVWQNNDQLNHYLKDFSAIYVRDALSQAAIQAASYSAEVVPDLTLSWPYTETFYEREGLLINGGVLLETQQQAWRASRHSPDVRYLSIRTLPPLRYQVHDRAYAKKALRQRVKYLRHLLSSYLMRNCEQPSKKQMSLLRWRHARLDSQAFLETLAQSSGVVTGRFHMITLCLLTRTPFFALRSNSHKVEALLEALGMQARLFDSYQDALEHRDHIAYSELEYKRIANFLAQARQMSAVMFAEIYAETLALKNRNQVP